MAVLFILFLAGLIAALLTGAIRKYALSSGLLDIPNDRSSHAAPTPRGGGVAIVMAFLASMISLSILGAVSFWDLISLGGAGLIVALVGFVDDHNHIPARWRLMAHFFAAGWILYFLGGLPPIVFFEQPVNLGWIGQALAALYLVWLLNLYNFMDGIDGIAGVEALTCGIGAGVLCIYFQTHEEEWILPVLLALSTLGFLIWNWPPAKIFMGDSGSGFLGFMLGALSLQSTKDHPLLVWGYIILLGVFVVDSTVTLLRRVLRGEKSYQAHRSHAFQHAADRANGHLPVTLAVGAINIAWLMPIAAIVSSGNLEPVFGVVLAYAPLVFLALKFRAGAAK